MTNHGSNDDAPPTVRERITEWLDGTLTRRRILPAHIVLVVAIAGAFYLLQQQREQTAATASDVAIARVERELDRCVNAVERTNGLRYNLNEIYDVLDYVFTEVELSGEFTDDQLERLRDRTDAGRAEIDQRYPARDVADCVSLDDTGGEDD